MPRTPIAEMEATEDGRLFIKLDGVRIAERKRIRKGVGRWQTIVPGYEVVDGPGLAFIEVRYNGVRIH